MAQFAILKTGGKQYLVQQNDEIIVDHLGGEENAIIDLDKLAHINEDKVEVGQPLLTTKVKVKVLAHMKGDKIRVARFRAKVRHRKVKGFRPMLTKLRIETL